MLVEKSAPTVFTALEDGTGVLLNLETLFYYTLNKTGVAIWQEIEHYEQPPTIDLLAKTVCKRFEIDEEGAHQGIVEFVNRLAELKMIRVSE
jgi:hypothetical protein